jgi:hypothetical protein
MNPTAQETRGVGCAKRTLSTSSSAFSTSSSALAWDSSRTASIACQT